MQQSTISPNNRQTTAPAAPHTAPTQRVESEPKMLYMCDICAEKAFSNRFQLYRQGWGIYRDFCFCPAHEEMD